MTAIEMPSLMLDPRDPAAVLTAAGDLFAVAYDGDGRTMEAAGANAALIVRVVNSHGFLARLAADVLAVDNRQTHRSFAAVAHDIDCLKSLVRANFPAG